MDHNEQTGASLAAAITKSASKQTYYTIRLLVDRGLVADAYRAYGYFRWLDDLIDDHNGTQSEKLALVNRQKELLEACYRGEIPQNLCPEEQMLAELAIHDSGENPGLESYLHNMMAVMAFDAGRRGRVISNEELSEYSRILAYAVTDAMYYFIDHDDPGPCHRARYLAVTAAHITHMLRDAIEDIQSGYINIPGEYMRNRGISPEDLESQAYREWVRSRVQLARVYFQAGRECIALVKNFRCRLAGYAYIARFEWMLDVIEREDYRLRRDYPERKGRRAGLWILWSTFVSMLRSPWVKAGARLPGLQPIRSGKS